MGSKRPEAPWESSKWWEKPSIPPTELGEVGFCGGATTVDCPGLPSGADRPFCGGESGTWGDTQLEVWYAVESEVIGANCGHDEACASGASGGSLPLSEHPLLLYGCFVWGLDATRQGGALPLPGRPLLL